MMQLYPFGHMIVVPWHSDTELQAIVQYVLLQPPLQAEGHELLPKGKDEVCKLV